MGFILVQIDLKYYWVKRRIQGMGQAYLPTKIAV